MSRASIVGMLIAAEVLIAGMAIYVIRGHDGWQGIHAAGFTGIHRVDFTASPIAPIAAGSSPHIVIDDAASHVTVSVSGDALVHVEDLTASHGGLFSSRSTYPQLHATRTSDGVRIERPETGDTFFGFFGLDNHAIEVKVPNGSRVEIASCSGADVAGIGGGVSVHSQDGHVTLTNVGGTVEARSDDGYVSASNVHGDRLTVESSDGHLDLQDVAVGTLDASTGDGRIEARGLTIAGSQPRATLHSDDGSVRVRGSFAPGGSYDISSNDGSIELGLVPGADLTVDASTGDGSIVADGSSYEGDDSAQHAVRVGNGTGSMKLRTSDGSIHITTNGAL